MWKAQERIGLDILRAIRAPLFEGAASLNRQLAALSRRCGGGGSGAGDNLPTAAQLQAAWAVLVIALSPAGVQQGLPQAEVMVFREQAARALLALQPDNPRSSFELGRTASAKAMTGSALHRHDVLSHYQRGAELARAQGSDYWLARWAVR